MPDEFDLLLEPEPDEYETNYCPFCDEENAPMGVLGNLLHYTCRQCGMWYSHEKYSTKPSLVEKEPDNE